MGLKDWLLYLFISTSLFVTSCNKGESPTEPVVNHRPVIEEIRPNTWEPFTEDRVSLECIATDKDEDYLDYDWSSDGGYFTDFENSRITWNAPDEVGKYHITAEVNDGKENGKTLDNILLTVISRFDTLYVTEDGFVDEYKFDFNSQNDSFSIRNLWVLKDNLGRVESYLKFEVPSRQNEIESVKLRFTLLPVGEIREDERKSLTVDMHRITEPWNQNDLKWENKSSYNFTPLQRIIIPGYLEFPNTFYVEGEENLVNLVEEWGSNSTENHGLAFVPTEDDISKYFYSAEGAQEEGNLDYAPAIIFEYK